MIFRKYVFWIFFMIGIGLASLTLAQTQPTHPTIKITPAIVLSHVEQLSADLSQIQKVLGKQNNSVVLFSVTNASPREVYFEAQSLFDKANRLSFEVVGSYQQAPKTFSEDITPEQVLGIIKKALERIKLVKEALKIPRQSPLFRIKPDTTPSDVFNAILRTSLQLNTLLKEKVTPGDVFEQVRLSTLYTQHILSSLYAKNIGHNLPKYQAGKTMADAFNKLKTCFFLIQEIAKKSKLQTLSIHTNRFKPEQVTPNGVMAVAKLVLAEVQYFNKFLSHKEVIHTYHPGTKTASDLYQQLEYLHEQLQMLLKTVSKKPNWKSTTREKIL